MDFLSKTLQQTYCMLLPVRISFSDRETSQRSVDYIWSAVTLKKQTRRTVIERDSF